MQIVIIDSNVLPTTAFSSVFFLFLRDSSRTFQVKSIDKFMAIVHKEKKNKNKILLRTPLFRTDKNGMAQIISLNIVKEKVPFS